MKRYWVYGVAAVLMLLIGTGVWFYFFNNPVNNRVVNTPIAESGTIIREGKFVEIDPVHKGSGGVSIRQNGDIRTLVFEGDFVVAPGPDLYIWLVKKQNLGSALGGVNTDKSTYLEIGKLKNISGKQAYSLTMQESMDYTYAVVIWCKAFNVQFTNAVLRDL